MMEQLIAEYLVCLPEDTGEDAVHPVPAGGVDMAVQLRGVTTHPWEDTQHLHEGICTLVTGPSSIQGRDNSL